MLTKNLHEAVAREATRPGDGKRNRRMAKVDPAATTSQYFWPFFSPTAVAGFPRNPEVDDKVNTLEWLVAIAKAMRYNIETGYRAEKTLVIVNPGRGGVGSFPDVIKEILQASGWEMEEEEVEGRKDIAHIILTPIGLAGSIQQEEKGEGT